MNCAKKLLEPTVFFLLIYQVTMNSGSESPWCKRDLSPIWNLDIKVSKGANQSIVYKI